MLFDEYPTNMWMVPILTTYGVDYDSLNTLQSYKVQTTGYPNNKPSDGLFSRLYLEEVKISYHNGRKESHSSRLFKRVEGQMKGR